VWQQGHGRLRWIAVPPVFNMKEALDQVRWSVDHGACGVNLRGFEGNRLVSDPYFFPLYEVAQELNVPITVHAGNANPTYSSLVVGSAWNNAKVPVLSAFHHVIYQEIPAKFPRLRFGFIEAAASWVPYMLTDLRRRMVRDGRTPLTENVLADSRVYVACQTNDDLPYVVGCVGEDNLVIGSDYGHSDTSSELEALKTLAQTSELEPRVVRKILEDNPKALYGL
jgi:predicted TIM-barrel fold metal-dependent hydrolase